MDEGPCTGAAVWGGPQTGLAAAPGGHENENRGYW